MSKKLAIGTDLILLDVKAGSGAFMKTPEDAAELAEACTALAADWGRPTRAAVTDMSQPLGEAIGNALDIVEAVRLLRGELHGRLRDAAVMFAGEAVSRLSDVPMGEGRARAAAALDSGEALEAFRRMIEAQGGDPRVVDDPEGVLPAAPVRRPIAAERAGTLAAVDAEALGRASGELGAGRKKKGDPIDPAVGIVFLAEGGRPSRGRTGARAGARSHRRGRRGVHPLGPGRDHALGRSGRSAAARSTGGTARWTTSSSRSTWASRWCRRWSCTSTRTRSWPFGWAIPTAKRWGRLTLNPKPLIDPFGSLILPALALILVAARGELLLPVFAYAKPLPVDTTIFKNPRRDMNLVVLAGLLANIVLAFLGGLVIRAGVTGELGTFAFAWLIVNAFMFGFQLMPVPGLDGAKLLAPFLPPRPREVFVNAEQYLVLFILVIFFILSGPLLSIVNGFANVACNLAAGIDCL